MAQGHAPGMLAVVPPDATTPVGVREALARVGLAGATVVEAAGATLATWGLDGALPGAGGPILLSGTNWSDAGAVAPAALAAWISSGAHDRLATMLPPFAAVGVVDGGLRLVTDGMGFRQAYLVEGPGWSAVSTSARLLATLAGVGIDEESLLLQSQLGWQLGQRTLFDGVTKLAPGEAVRLHNGRAHREAAPPDPVEPAELFDAASRATVLLRDLLDRYLAENPDPILQLTGGQDSRIVLSSIPPSRRRGVRVMTLGVPGAMDVEVASTLAERFGMHHTVRSLDGLAGLDPQEAFERACAAASRLDCMSDPLARAATLWAEESFEQGPRLSGLGGEIARGFYYTGRVHDTPVTPERAEQLARWRMLANEAVEPAALHPRLQGRAVPRSIGIIHESLTASGLDWYRATDELYYRHRMQRWAGLGESAVCFDRSIVNPMLDHRFLALARALPPTDKQNSRFLALLQLRLDDELARVPLDNRPAPVAYASPNLVNRARQRWARAGAAASKLNQRVRGARRPPPGGAVLAAKVAEHLRAEPAVVGPARDLRIFSDEWLDSVTSGLVQPKPGSLALLVNVLVAVEATGSTR